MEEEEAKRIMETLTDSITSGEKQEMEDSTKEIVKKAAQIVGSLKDTEFDIRSEILYTRRVSAFLNFTVLWIKFRRGRLSKTHL
jgi:hypothetical protein